MVIKIPKDLESSCYPLETLKGICPNCKTKKVKVYQHLLTNPTRFNFELVCNNCNTIITTVATREKIKKEIYT